MTRYPPLDVARRIAAEAREFAQTLDPLPETVADDGGLGITHAGDAWQVQFRSSDSVIYVGRFEDRRRAFIARNEFLQRCAQIAGYEAPEPVSVDKRGRVVAPPMTPERAKQIASCLEALGAFTGHGKLGPSLAALGVSRSQWRKAQQLLGES